MPDRYIPYLAVARFSGSDAGSFLQSQLSADVLAVEAGTTGFACYCTPKGQVLGLLLLGREGDDWLLGGSETLLPAMLKRLQMYVLRSKVTIEPAADLAVTGGSGPEYSFSERGDPLQEIEKWRAAELRAGISWLRPGSAEKFIPQMLGFDALGAVSFRKGCYPGQEIVARARYLGKVKRGPLIVETEDAPGAQAGDKVRIRRGDEWSDAVLVDSAEYDGGAVLFTVAATGGAQPAEELEFGGRSYRCATT